MEHEASSSSQGFFGQAVAGHSSGPSTTMTTPLRPGTPTDLYGRNPFGDSGGDSQTSHRAGGNGTNPFASPSASRPASSFGSSSAAGGAGRSDDRSGGQRYFHSRRIDKDQIEKPWTKNKDPKEKWVTIVPIIGIFIGLAISGFLVWDGLSSVVHHTYCTVLDDDFSGGLDPTIWTQEVQLGGFGNGEFEETTADGTNVFVQNGNLMIQATLQNDALMQQNSEINLLTDGTCTSTSYYDCVAATNTTAGNVSVVPPTLSGRINTMKGATITYGRVEVTAKMPQGDWLWPAIWLLPVNNTYGPWPESGEIDIAESRGNDHTYPLGGNNIVSSTLHWGPNPANDAFWRTNVKRQSLHSTYSQEFHTYGLEWSEKYLFTFIDSRLLQVLYTNFDEPLWQRGDFPAYDTNGTKINLPWDLTGRPQTPFDQPFYLILNLAVGGTNGWFEDDVAGKPWSDTSPSAKKDFYNARDTWYPTWVQPQLEVSRVVMLQQCDPGENDL